MPLRGGRHRIAVEGSGGRHRGRDRRHDSPRGRRIREIRQELSGRYWYDHAGRNRVELNGRTTIVDPVGGVHGLQTVPGVRMNRIMRRACRSSD